MFEEKQNQNIDTNMDQAQKVFDSLESEKELEINDDNIHSMPERFLMPSEMKSGKNNAGLIILIVVVLLVVLAVAGFAFYVFYDNKKTSDQDILNVEQNTTTTQEIIDINTQDNLQTPELRDKKRLDDVLEIRTALSLYFKEQGKYPNSLFDLSSYLTTIPINPSPGGESYNYQVKDANKDYIVTFAFEGNIENGNLIFNSGKYQLGPIFGIEPYKEVQNNEDQDSIDNDNNIPDDVNADNNQQMPIIPPKGTDTDDDGLTDAEEIIFQTNVDLVDTDSDTYNDKEEILNLYDPTKIDGKLLENISLARVFIEEELKYSFVYPAKWMAQTKDKETRDVMIFEAENKDFIKIQAKDNPQELSAKNWYLNTSPEVNPDDLSNYKNRNNLVGVKSKDGLNVYISTGNKIYIISYISIDTVKLNYQSIFDLIANTFKISI